VIQVQLNNEILNLISSIDEKKVLFRSVKLPKVTRNKLRKVSKKKSSYASNKIEGNPLTEEQANAAIESDEHKHFLGPEKEMRNYFQALEFLEAQRLANTDFSTDLILQTQELVEWGASKEKIGLRGPTPPGVLFAVYDSETGAPEYIPPQADDIPDLLEELVSYVNTTDDHPLIVAAVVHYQLVTIHPFEDGNGRTARLLSGYIIDRTEYSFAGIGSLEEYFAYDIDEYYQALQMDLPASYYEGRDNPPHPEIWVEYFLRMVELYTNRVFDLANESSEEALSASLSHLNLREQSFLKFLLEKHLNDFKPVEVAPLLGVTNRTVTNRCAKLAQEGFLVPHLVNKRVSRYSLSDFTQSNSATLFRLLRKNS